MAPLTPIWTKEQVVEKLTNNNKKNNNPFVSNDDCIIKQLSQNECTFDRYTGEFVCIPFTRLFKECRTWKKVKQKVEGRVSVKKALVINRVEITDLDTNDRNLLDNVKKLPLYEELKR
ncbi:Som1p SCDLUD_000953 [Saccharomycodes ludwigii]|uniref:Som1p n=1 Tax=Saccharomycodes ludwigii TaxID=36035 RepID=UPI001E83857D|nr:hypothetical protein SCDLUD_000953 [Saccharomycodes ludwigii]KAH3903327.1 hypothetical protein SCDLUD_000953 [Saccharomycodes ludwigii]